MTTKQIIAEARKSGAALRVLAALLRGWAFQYFKKAAAKTSRHSVYAQEPDEEGWVCHKAPGDDPDWVNALLDEAGVPRYD